MPFGYDSHQQAWAAHARMTDALDLAVGIVRGVAAAVPHDAPGWGALQDASMAVTQAAAVFRDHVGMGPRVGERYATAAERKRWGATHIRAFDARQPGATAAVPVVEGVGAAASRTGGSPVPQAPTSTVGRGKAYTLEEAPEIDHWTGELVDVRLGDSMSHYESWPEPGVIISDGGYGVLGFEGDTSDHLDLPQWYEPHVERWSKHATPSTTLWFWNSEIGWAAVHPILERHGWRYVNCNIWNKGKAHIAGNINTKTIRRFPVVSEVCVQYVFEARIDNRPLKRWLKDEWQRTGTPLRKANEACGVRDAATRKYLDQGHLWYFPPPKAFQGLADYANEHGRPEGRPYFSRDGVRPMTGEDWSGMRSKFSCPHAVTNIWDRNPVHGPERIKAPSGRAVHLNQKPLDLLQMLIEASSAAGDVVWEPFGGLFSACVAAMRLKRRGFGCEIDPTYFSFGVRRLVEESGG